MKNNKTIALLFLTLFFTSTHAFFITNNAQTASGRFSLTPEDNLRITVEGSSTPLINFENSDNKTILLRGVNNPIEDNDAVNKKYLENIVPIGGIIPWYNAPGKNLIIPSIFVEVNGQTITDPTSPLDGITLPNLNGEQSVLAGGGNGQHEGSNTLTLSTNQMPEHNHASTANTHTHTANTNAQTHRHNLLGDPSRERGSVYLHQERSFYNGGSTFSSASGIQNITPNIMTNNTHSHTISVQNTSHNHAIQNSGGGESFDNRQRTFGITWLMRIK